MVKAAYAMFIVVATSLHGPFSRRVLAQQAIPTAASPPSPALHAARTLGLVVTVRIASAAGAVGAGWSGSAGFTHAPASVNPDPGRGKPTPKH